MIHRGQFHTHVGLDEHRSLELCTYMYDSNRHGATDAPQSRILLYHWAFGSEAPEATNRLMCRGKCTRTSISAPRAQRSGTAIKEPPVYITAVRVLPRY